jgi:hypothetical protein
MAASTSVAKAADCREQKASTVPFPYWQEAAPGLVTGEGAALGVAVGAMDGVGDGGVVGVDPEHAPTNSKAAAATIRRL